MTKSRYMGRLILALSIMAAANAWAGGPLERLMENVPAPWDMDGWMKVMSGRPSGDATRGAALASKAYCYTCHGDKGVPPSRNAPRLAGQDGAYLFKALHDYRSGRMLIDNKSLGMRAVMQPLSEQDMADLAAYYAAQAAPPPASANMPAVAAGCVACHQANGQPGAGGSGPGLGGQSSAYLVRQLKAFKKGTRTTDVGGLMRAMLAALDEQQIQQLADFYSGK